MKKIIVDKSEGIAEIIDRVLAVDGKEIILHIPKGSALAKSGSNFRLLKREADEAEKTITIDSQDEAVLAFAAEHDIAAADPAPKHMAAGMSDIVPKKVEPKAEPAAIAKEDDEEEEKSFLSSERFFKPRTAPAKAAVRNDDDDDEDEESSHGGSGKVVGWIVGVIVLAAIIFYGATILFGHAQVTIDFTQTPWTYQSNFVADKSVSAPTENGTSVSIPAQIFTAQKNITQLFPATGPSVGGGTKAQGTITVYNNYSSASQQLVATTRFVTPSGQIFRLANDITVPGASVAAGGTITPSSIDAAIVADQAGPAYNVGPVTKLTIPGFQTVPAKYAGFYGQIKGQTTGGATGSHPTATVTDITSAKASTTAILQSDLQAQFSSMYPNNFKILDGATDITVGKLIVSTTTDANGNFSVFGEASLTAIGFDESALENYLLSLAQSQSGAGNNTTMAFKAPSPTLNYSNVQASFSKGQVSFALQVQGTIEPAFSSDEFAQSVAGKSIGDARSAIAALPELADGKISVWPIWLWSMPSDPKKIEVTVN